MSHRGKKSRYLSIAAGLALAILLSPIASGAAQPIVKEIEIEGHRRVSDASVMSAISTSVGAPLNYEFIDRDVKAIFGLGQFRDVKVRYCWPHQNLFAIFGRNNLFYRMWLARKR